MVNLCQNQGGIVPWTIYNILALFPPFDGICNPVVGVKRRGYIDLIKLDDKLGRAAN